MYDLYCGIGTISLALALESREVIGVELVERAVADAIENAKLNGVDNARFYAGDIRTAMRPLIEEEGKADVVVIDPPRAGLSQKVVRRVLEVEAEKIVYVSCNPTTLAPNARQMVDAGYELKTVRPVDMFPQTPHIECVALLERSGQLTTVRSRPGVLGLVERLVRPPDQLVGRLVVAPDRHPGRAGQADRACASRRRSITSRAELHRPSGDTPARTPRRRSARAGRSARSRGLQVSSTWRSSASPAWWPWSSLKSLKWSRSSRATQMWSPLRRARASSRRSPWSHARRLGRPVSSSVRARRSILLRAGRSRSR